MNLFRPRTRGRLSGNDVDTLARWSLRAAVEEYQPGDVVWQRIAANTRGRGPRRMARRTADQLRFTLDSLASFAGPGTLMRFMLRRMRDGGREAFPLTRAEDDYGRAALAGPGPVWAAFSSPDLLALGTRLSAGWMV